MIERQSPTPKISVLLPVYNGEKHVLETVESILKQTYENFEFIIINDGSRDGTKEILESLTDNRLRIVHKQNEGLGRTLNLGLQLARGEYIARIDADDVATPDRLAKQVVYLDANPEIAVLGSALRIVYTDGGEEKIRQRPLSPRDVRRQIIKINPIAHPAVMFRREVIQRVGGFDTSFDGSLGKKYGMDYNLWVRVLAAGYEMANLPEALMMHRKHRGSISGSKGFSFMVRERIKVRLWAKKMLHLGPVAFFEIAAVSLLTLLQYVGFSGLDRIFNMLSGGLIGNRASTK